MLTADRMVDSTQQPIQFMILSEQNKLKDAQLLFDRFTSDNNFKVIMENGEYIKQQYNSPVVLSNFEDVVAGQRSILYVTGTLFIMENLLDIQDLKIDGQDAIAIRNGITYVMTTDTQQFVNDNISTSVKNSSTVGITLVLVFKKSDYMKKIFNIVKGTNTGNENFAISFTLDKNDSDYNFSMNMKLQNADISGAINDFPTIKVSFMK